MDVTLGDGAKLSAHGLRAAVLGEVHARPFTPMETPRRVLHFAFETAGERSAIRCTSSATRSGPGCASAAIGAVTG